MLLSTSTRLLASFHKKSCRFYIKLGNKASLYQVKLLSSSYTPNNQPKHRAPPSTPNNKPLFKKIIDNNSNDNNTVENRTVVSSNQEILNRIANAMNSTDSVHDDKNNDNDTEGNKLYNEIEVETDDITKDARLIFDKIFDEISSKSGLENMTFPKDIMWLSGAPGSGKGEMCKFISEQRGYYTKPIRMSEILTGKELDNIKKSGSLVSDRTVIKMLFEKLLEPQYNRGVIVDGFPRTALQAECIKLLFDRILWLRRKFEKQPDVFKKFHRPVFHVTVLYCDTDVSVQRQLQRGKEIIENNRIVKMTGVGIVKEIRETDLSSDLALERYKQFHKHIYSSLQIIKEKFPFHFINAEGSKDEVKSRIIKELEYQSKRELSDDTFDNVRRIPLASEIRVHARSELVERLDYYQKQHRVLFNHVIDIINDEFVGIVRQQALTGQVIVRSENKVFVESRGLALNMVLDLLSERGYRVVLDYLKERYPVNIDLKTGNIEFDRRKIFIFHISFPPPTIRHAVQHVGEWDSSIV